MRTFTLLAAGAMLTPAAFAAGKSPVPVSYGFNKAIKFQLNEQQNNITSGTSSDMTPVPGIPNGIMGLGGTYLLTPPPVFNHQGNCCRPTPQCHAYFKWVIDVLNSEGQFETKPQRAEAMGHMDCCIKQFRASCADPPKGSSIVWNDPAKGCSNEKVELPEGIWGGRGRGRTGADRAKEEGKKQEEEVPAFEMMENIQLDKIQADELELEA